MDLEDTCFHLALQDNLTIAISTYIFCHINRKSHVFAHRGTARFKRTFGTLGAPVNATTYSSTMSKTIVFGP